MTALSAYADLERRFQRLTRLREAAGMLHWDMSVMMPAGGAEARAEQLAALDLTCHEMLTDESLGDLLSAAADEELNNWQGANLAEMNRRRLHAKAVDGDLVAALSRASSSCEMIWREARAADDFAAVAPALAEVLVLVRHAADAKAAALGTTPYEALLDEYEPGARIEKIDALFADLAAFLPDFLDDVLTRQESMPVPQSPPGPFPVARQRDVCAQFMTALGFDFDHGRLDLTLHPFCGGVPEDVRVTTRFDEADFASGLMAVLHETGHALYEMGLPAEWREQPVGESRGMVLHESQSLLIEMQVCRGREFLAFAGPILARAFGGDGPAWSPDNLAPLFARVERGFIRVDADEVTYPAHVIQRYRLERAMIAGDLEIADLPAAWNAGLEALLGIAPPDDRQGCLQDIHWYGGDWGYFPTYTMGALAAAQLFAAARDAVGEIPAAIAGGDFAPLLDWLRASVHGRGSLLATDALLTEATGEAPGTDAFKRHLRARYLGP